MRKLLSVFTILAVSATVVDAKVILPSVLSDNMVIQRDTDTAL